MMSKIENFFEKHNISASDKNEKTKLYELYKSIKEDLKHFSKKNISFTVGKLSLIEIKILGIALKILLVKRKQNKFWFLFMTFFYFFLLLNVAKT